MCAHLHSSLLLFFIFFFILSFFLYFYLKRQSALHILSCILFSPIATIIVIITLYYLYFFFYFFLFCFSLHTVFIIITFVDVCAVALSAVLRWHNFSFICPILFFTYNFSFCSFQFFSSAPHLFVIARIEYEMRWNVR